MMAINPAREVEGSSFVKFRDAADLVFLGIFLAEMLLKMASLGVDVFEPDTYFRQSGWNCLDFDQDRSCKQPLTQIRCFFPDIWNVNTLQFMIF